MLFPSRRRRRLNQRILKIGCEVLRSKTRFIALLRLQAEYGANTKNAVQKPLAFAVDLGGLGVPFKTWAVDLR